MVGPNVKRGKLFEVRGCKCAVLGRNAFSCLYRTALCYATVISKYIENRYVYLKRSFNVNFRFLCRRNVCLELCVLKVCHFRMNKITIIYIIVVIVVMSEGEQAENGSCQNQNEGPVSRES